MKKVVTVISAVIIAGLCGVYLLFSISGFGWKTLAVPTGSMQPSIPRGSLVFMHRVPISSLQAGDIITYTNPLNAKTTITHRIYKKIRISGIVPGFVTKGDANKLADIPIAAGQVKGKVVWHFPDAGFVIMASKKPFIILPIIYTAALILVFDELIRLNDHFKSQQPYRLFGYKRRHVAESVQDRKPLAVGGTVILAAVILLGALFTPVVHALLKSNTVKLTHNSLSVATNLPTNKDQCKNNGWKIYVVFKNQGDCVSYVATHGKNLPAKL